MKRAKTVQTGITSSVRRSVSILLIFAALATAGAAKAADFSDPAAINQTSTGVTHPNGFLNFIQVLYGTVCYTPMGAAPMLYPFPVGSACHVGYVSGVVGL